MSTEAVTLHTILLGVGGTCFIENTLNQFKQLDLIINVPLNLHTHDSSESTWIECVPFSLLDERRVSSAYVVFLFFLERLVAVDFRKQACWHARVTRDTREKGLGQDI
eukprot:1143348-Pelagomonas_calceolata.AAC.5